MNVKNEILSRINRYFDGDITKDELGRWASENYHRLLKGECLEIDKIAVYHFMKTLSQFHVAADDMADIYPSTEHEVRRIKAVLEGSEDADDMIEMRLAPELTEWYQQLNRKDMENQISGFRALQAAISEYKENPGMTEELRKLVKSHTSSPSGCVLTLADLLAVHLNSLLSANTYLRLWPTKTTAGQTLRLEQVCRILNCLTGIESFSLLILYRGGISHLSVLI